MKDDTVESEVEVAVTPQGVLEEAIFKAMQVMIDSTGEIHRILEMNEKDAHHHLHLGDLMIVMIAMIIVGHNHLEETIDQKDTLGIKRRKVLMVRGLKGDHLT